MQVAVPPWRGWSLVMPSLQGVAPRWRGRARCRTKMFKGLRPVPPTPDPDQDLDPYPSQTRHRATVTEYVIRSLSLFLSFSLSLSPTLAVSLTQEGTQRLSSSPGGYPESPILTRRGVRAYHSHPHQEGTQSLPSSPGWGQTIPILTRRYPEPPILSMDMTNVSANLTNWFKFCKHS